WLWKNKRDEENTVIQNKSRLVAKGYAQKEDSFSIDNIEYVEASPPNYELVSSEDFQGGSGSLRKMYSSLKSENTVIQNKSRLVAKGYAQKEDSFSIDNIEYVEASPPNYELVSSEVMEIVIYT
nr:retrovirus-related Pol polyprotein from transposon TNT 1-94 [Tanacetum cinerariifolium]